MGLGGKGQRQQGAGVSMGMGMGIGIGIGIGMGVGIGVVIGMELGSYVDFVSLSIYWCCKKVLRMQFDLIFQSRLCL